MQTSLQSSPLLLLPCLLASLAACASDVPVDELYSSDLQDGYEFQRELEPQVIQLNMAASSATFAEEAYIAHEFTIDTSQRVHIYTDFNWKQDLENALDSALYLRADKLSYRVAYAVFSYNEAAGAYPWDRLSTFTGRWAQDTTIDLQAGRYLVLTLGSEEAYEDEVEIALEFSGEAGVTKSPGRMQIRVLTLDGRNAEGIRVAVGSQSAHTDESGTAYISNIPRGFYDIKFGEDGLGRSSYLPNNWIIGNNVNQERAIIIGNHQYEEWRQ